jgi:hypothetical protein
MVEVLEKLAMGTCKSKAPQFLSSILGRFDP